MRLLKSRRTFLSDCFLSTACAFSASSHKIGLSNVADFLKAASIGSDIRIGFAFHDDAYLHKDFLSHASRQGDHVVFKGICKRRALEPKERGVFNWVDIDKYYPWLAENQLGLHWHTLTWYDGNPTWLNQQLESGGATIDLIGDYISSVTDRYKGNVMSWDVANECFIPTKSGPAFRPSREYIAFGKESFELPFFLVRECDPKALRVLNQNFLVSNRRSDISLRSFFLGYLADALKRGVPIQAVGLQCHLQPGVIPFDRNVFGALLDDLRNLGLHVILSEVSFATNLVKGSRMIRDLVAAQEVGELVETYLTRLGRSRHGRTIRFWGLTRKFSDYPGGQAEILDEHYMPGPVFQSIKRSIVAVNS